MGYGEAKEDCSLERSVRIWNWLMRYSRVGCYSSPLAYCLPLPGQAVEPAANLVAVAAAPPMIEATLKAAYVSTTRYFPFSDGYVPTPG